MTPTDNFNFSTHSLHVVCTIHYVVYMNEWMEYKCGERLYGSFLRKFLSWFVLFLEFSLNFAKKEVLLVWYNNCVSEGVFYFKLKFILREIYIFKFLIKRIVYALIERFLSCFWSLKIIKLNCNLPEKHVKLFVKVN